MYKEKIIPKDLDVPKLEVGQLVKLDIYGEGKDIYTLTFLGYMPLIARRQKYEWECCLVFIPPLDIEDVCGVNPLPIYDLSGTLLHVEETLDHIRCADKSRILQIYPLETNNHEKI